jgi:hypothetical protein
VKGVVKVEAKKIRIEKLKLEEKSVIQVEVKVVVLVGGEVEVVVVVAAKKFKNRKDLDEKRNLSY